MSSKNEKSLKKLAEETSEPMLNAALKTIKCDIDKLKDKVSFHNERSKLSKPNDMQHMTALAAAAAAASGSHVSASHHANKK